MKRSCHFSSTTYRRCRFETHIFFFNFSPFLPLLLLSFPLLLLFLLCFLFMHIYVCILRVAILQHLRRRLTSRRTQMFNKKFSSSKRHFYLFSYQSIVLFSFLFFFFLLFFRFIHYSSKCQIVKLTN